jgi:hypothetical protein
MVSTATYTIGFQILKKIFEKKFGEYKNYVLPLAGTQNLKSCIYQKKEKKNILYKDRV